MCKASIVCSSNSQLLKHRIFNLFWHQGVRFIIIAVKLPMWLNRCLHLLQYLIDFSSLLLFPWYRQNTVCAHTQMWVHSGFCLNPHLANYSDLPNCRDHPKASYSERNTPSSAALWRDIQHASPTPLIGQFRFKWACFASTHFFPHIFQCCGFYWLLSSRGCWCLDWGTQQQLVGLLMVVRPAGCSVLGFEWCQAQQLPRSPTALSEDAC